MKKKVILFVIVAIAVSGAFIFTKCLKVNSNQKQVNVLEENKEELNLQEEEQSENEQTTETTENESNVADVKNESPKIDTSRQENNSKQTPKVSETPKKVETKTNNVPTQSNKQQEEQPKQENKVPESNKANGSNNQVQQNKVSTTFYDSITHGKKEFSSESEALSRGTQIQNNELDYVLDWNEAHPENQIQPEINYFRVYPSVIDENGKYWYYLHFFCQSGEGLDQELKSKY